MGMACASVCGHDSEKKTLITSKSKYAWYVHVQWHSKCAKQSIHHPKSMYDAKQLFRHGMQANEAVQAIMA